MPIAQAEFGRTGHQSSRVVFGGASLAQVDQRTADQTLDVLLEYGVNHLDVASEYGDAEVRIRPWLQREPGRFFLATKGDQRTAAAAREELHRSLDRMGVDHVDLWQLHALADPIEWDIALSPGGALEAALEARDQGLIRYIGVTGHGSQIAATHRRSLDRFDFDSVLLPYNYVTMANRYYAENFNALYDTCRQRRVAVQTIKSIALRPWSGREHTAATWYEPLTEQADIDLAVWWALGRTGTFLCSVGDVGLLPKVLNAASRLADAPDDVAMATLYQRTEADPLFV
ncbi:MAG TPA: aldo/keto reductase [Streptosporangiaceae bacterium]|jgi:aryl-alcohol dehydrogenase-like predicted oxidoreductase